jgi:hypothetical protein
MFGLDKGKASPNPSAEGNFEENHYKAFYTENQKIKIIRG